MSHIQQREFVKEVKSKFPRFFLGGDVLEVGSLNINGTIRGLFSKPKSYWGIDLMAGKGVDAVVSGHELKTPDNTFDMSISVECFEHDKHYMDTFMNMYRMTKHGGMVLFTCATDGRAEHGTIQTNPKHSPATTDYYMNVNEAHFNSLNFKDMFSRYSFEYNGEMCDLYFWGIKK